MMNDPVFWQSLVNNAWFAIGTIPVSIALALLMAVWVNGKLRGPGVPAPRLLHADGAADDRRWRTSGFSSTRRNTDCSSR
jgi:hypothetical protein